VRLEKIIRKLVVAFSLVALACTSQPPAATCADPVRTAIDTKYVGVPSMKIFAEPNESSQLFTEYGCTETVAVSEQNGNSGRGHHEIDNPITVDVTRGNPWRPAT